MTRTVSCDECGGSGYRSCNGREFPCIDCGGEGTWEADEEETTSTLTLSDLRELYGNPFGTEVRGDPFPNELRAA